MVMVMVIWSYYSQLAALAGWFLPRLMKAAGTPTRFVSLSRSLAGLCLRPCPRPRPRPRPLY